MGPLLLARLLELNDVQEGVLNLTFKVADDEGQPAQAPRIRRFSTPVASSNESNRMSPPS